MLLLLRDKSLQVLTGRHLAETEYLSGCEPPSYIAIRYEGKCRLTVSPPLLIGLAEPRETDAHLSCSTDRLGCYH